MVAGGDSCSEPLEPTVPISGCTVIVVAPETSQLSVVRCPGLMLVGVVVKELIVGGTVGPCWVDAGAAGSCLTMVMQPAVEPIKTTSDMAISVKYHLHFIIYASGFVGIIDAVGTQCQTKSKIKS
jgi:hypothetical protein